VKEMVSVNDVQQLNSRIERINVQRTKAESREEVLRSQLSASLSAYEKAYGLSLVGATFEETKAMIQAEYERVTREVESEYEFKNKLVSLIERGAYDDAYALCGESDTQAGNESQTDDESQAEEYTGDSSLDEVVTLDDSDESNDEVFDESDEEVIEEEYNTFDETDEGLVLEDEDVTSVGTEAETPVTQNLGALAFQQLASGKATGRVSANAVRDTQLHQIADKVAPTNNTKVTPKVQTGTVSTGAGSSRLKTAQSAQSSQSQATSRLKPVNVPTSAVTNQKFRVPELEADEDDDIDIGMSAQVMSGVASSKSKANITQPKTNTTQSRVNTTQAKANITQSKSTTSVKPTIKKTISSTPSSSNAVFGGMPDLEVEGDDDVLGNIDFGFGGMLEGTKFSGQGK